MTKNALFTAFLQRLDRYSEHDLVSRYTGFTFFTAFLHRLDPYGRRDLVPRFVAWKMRWLPYRTAVLLGWDDDGPIMGPWTWNKPTRWRKEEW